MLDAQDTEKLLSSCGDRPEQRSKCPLGNVLRSVAKEHDWPKAVEAILKRLEGKLGNTVYFLSPASVSKFYVNMEDETRNSAVDYASQNNYRKTSAILSACSDRNCPWNKDS